MNFKRLLSYVGALTVVGCMSAMTPTCPEGLAVLRIGTDAAAGLNPWSYLGSGKTWQGFERALSCELRGRLGFNEIKVSQVAFGNLITQLTNNTVDIIISDISISPTFPANTAWVKYNNDVLGMIFTQQVFNGVQKFATANGFGTITGNNVLAVMEAFANAAGGILQVAVNNDRREQFIIADNAFPDLVPRPFATRNAAVDSLTVAPESLAYFTDNAVAKQLQSEKSILVVVENVIVPPGVNQSISRGIGIGIRTECCQLYVNIAQAIKDMEADGTLEALRKQFNTGTFTPDDTLTPPICSGTKSNNPVRNELGVFIDEKFCVHQCNTNPPVVSGV